MFTCMRGDFRPQRRVPPFFRASLSSRSKQIAVDGTYFLSPRLHAVIAIISGANGVLLAISRPSR
jgi:hypothetical protein